MSFAYPDAALFPRAFQFTFHGTPVGAIPIFMYLTPFANTARTGLGSIGHHNWLKISNPNHPTTQNPDIVAKTFEEKLNMGLNFTTTQICLKRGPEAVPLKAACRGIALNPDEDIFMQFGDTESVRLVRAIVAGMRKNGYWNLFITLTINQELSPGVRNFNLMLKQYYGRSHYLQAYQSFLPIYVRLCQRTLKMHIRWIVSSPERPAGWVKTFLVRFESQDGAGGGNPKHAHMGVTLHPEPTEDTLNRIACRLQDMKQLGHGHFGDVDFRLGTDFQGALKDKLVRSYEDYCGVFRDWRAFFVSINFTALIKYSML